MLPVFKTGERQVCLSLVCSTHTRFRHFLRHVPLPTVFRDNALSLFSFSAEGLHEEVFASARA